MKSTREKILRTLLAFPGSTIIDLAEAVGINGISIRHHLTSLEADGLVTSSEERHGVGRPHLVYTLTDKGIEQFPTSWQFNNCYFLSFFQNAVFDVFKLIRGCLFRQPLFLLIRIFILNI